MICHSDAVAFEDLGQGVKRRVLSYATELMMVEVIFEEGALGALHSHPHSQISYVQEGELEVYLGESIVVLKKGDTFYVEPHLVHGVKALAPSTLVDVFTPQREDFLKS